MKTSTSISALFVIASSAFAQQNASPETGCRVDYQLQKSGFVSLAIEDSSGRRVRNLVSSGWREAGKQSDWWDGLDDAGKPVPAGDFRWKGIVHDGIKSYFVGVFNSPGNPPWNTAQFNGGRGLRPSGNGGWLSDHGRPGCAYTDGSRIYFGSPVAEAGHSMMELDTEGRKLWGTLWLSLAGANAIFKEGEILYVAGEKGWMNDSLSVNRLNVKSHHWVKNPGGPGFKKDEPAFIKVKSAEFSGIKGLVVTPDWIVLSLSDRDRLACFSVQDGSHVKDIPLPGAGTLLKLRDGAILAISGQRVVRVDLQNGRHQTVVSKDLLEPVGLAVDSKGQILLSDVAAEEQCIKVFSPEGKFLRRIGKQGGRREGPFDPMAMDQPRAIAVDDKDQVWVGEHSFLPKRISAWRMDGTLIHDFIGGPYYGGGGALDPQNTDRAFYRGMEFSWAPWPARSTLKSVLFRPEEHDDLPLPAKAHESLPQFPVRHDGRLYLMHDEGPGLKGVLIGEVAGKRLVPRAIFGPYRTLWETWRERYPDFIQTLAPNGKTPSMGAFLWQDLNGDGKAEPSEVTLQPDWRFGAEWALRSSPTLNLYARRGKDEVIMVAPESGDGPLRYNLEKASVIPLPEIIKKKSFCASAPDLEGNLILNGGGGGNQGDTENVLMSITPAGQVRWTYPNPYPANWHSSPRARLGDIQHTLNVEGIASIGGEVGDVFQLNGNKGVRYLFTTDGLFLTQLFGDMRNTPLMNSLSAASKDLQMDQVSLGDECFFGWFGKAQDGRVLQIVGKDSSNILEVRGLETVVRLKGGPLHLEETAQVQEVVETRKATSIRALQGAIPAGWEKRAGYHFPQGAPIAHFAMAYGPQELTLSIEVEKAGPFANAGEDPKTLFKSGDAVDLRFAANPKAPAGRNEPVEGDQRLLFSLYQGEPVAVRYRFVVSGTDDTSKVKFASPTGLAAVDEVAIQKEVKVKIEPRPNGYRLVARIPWKVLGLDNAPTETMRGDVGVIMADPGGSSSVARHYYFDQHSQVVSDLPSEVRVTPSRWGELSF